MPEVSVIIPAYNAMAYLPQTLDSVLKQTFKDFEVIIVNDGSNDGIELWFSNITDSRVKLISQENKGLAGARNTGILRAQGKYLAFLDADDLWNPTKLEKQAHILAENPEVGLVYTWVTYIDETGELTGRTFKNNVEGDVWRELIKHNIVECGSVAMVRRSCFEVVGVFDQNLRSFVEDWDMWLRVSSQYSFKVVREPLVYYRQLPTSASKNWQAMEESFKLVIQKAFNTASSECQALKEQSYASAYICLAWKALQSRDRDYRKAADFRKKSLGYYPPVWQTKEFWRLSLAIALMQTLGAGGYSNFLSIVYKIRRHLVAAAR